MLLETVCLTAVSHLQVQENTQKLERSTKGMFLYCFIFGVIAAIFLVKPQTQGAGDRTTLTV